MKVSPLWLEMLQGNLGNGDGDDAVLTVPP